MNIKRSLSPKEQEQLIQSYEYGLPRYLQQDLDAFKEGLETNSSLLDCLWCELYGSINIAQREPRKFCVIDIRRQYEVGRLSQE